MQIALAYDVNAGLGWADASLAERVLQRGLRAVHPGLASARQRSLARQAAALGYAGLWTPDWPGMDAFALCRERWRASVGVKPGGIEIGTAVSPIRKYPNPLELATRAREMASLTGGRFVL